MDCADSENEKGLTSHALTEMLNKIETLEVLFLFYCLAGIL